MSTNTLNPVKQTTKKTIILVVEDEPSLLKVLSKRIGELDCELITADNGEEAFAAFNKHQPDIVITDVIMPKLNGFDLLQKLRAKYNDKFKAIVLTNLDNTSDIEMARSLGVNEFLLKSDISLRKLQQKIQVLLAS